jgi:DNA topoisomerase-1
MALLMATRIGWTRVGSKRRFRYLDGDGREITDEVKLERIRALVIPPAWRQVWINPSARAKLQATGIDAAGRKQYLYHPDFRAKQEAAKYAKLIRFAEALPALRDATAEHIDLPGLPEERVAAIAVRLINLGWFRAGSDRYAKSSRTFGITTLRKSHVSVRGARISFKYRGKHSIMLRSAIIDGELAAAMKELVAQPGARLFQFEADGVRCNLDSRRLNAYIRRYLGEEFTAKDFRTWGGTLLAAVEFADHPLPETEADAKRRVAAVMRKVGEKLGNTPAVARSSYVSPAVVEQYLDGRTIEDFRPRKLRVVGARDLGLDPEEKATLSLLRSWRIRAGRAAA